MIIEKTFNCYLRNNEVIWILYYRLREQENQQVMQ